MSTTRSLIALFISGVCLVIFAKGQASSQLERKLQNEFYPALTVIYLGLCQGSCHLDENCAGDLICFQRTGGDPVPGCAGNDEQPTGYCILPTSIANQTRTEPPVESPATETLLPTASYWTSLGSTETTAPPQTLSSAPSKIYEVSVRENYRSISTAKSGVKVGAISEQRYDMEVGDRYTECRFAFCLYQITLSEISRNNDAAVITFTDLETVMEETCDRGFPTHSLDGDIPVRIGADWSEEFAWASCVEEELCVTPERCVPASETYYTLQFQVTEK